MHEPERTKPMTIEFEGIELNCAAEALQHSNADPRMDTAILLGGKHDAVAKATKLGGVLRFGPMDTPFGRFAALSDPQGASFSVIDVTRTHGEMPELKDVD